MYKQYWYSKINNSNKLETYSLFKHEFIFEQYLDYIKNKKFRMALTKFRTSSHSLNIETGRYVNTPRINRLFVNCIQQQVENEYLFAQSIEIFVNNS